jgi:two-component system chemotaxis sensor kinase CheA
MGELDAIVKEFLLESRENLDQFERGLVELEKDPSARETLDNVFRSIHSIKGATGFLGLSKLGAVAHAGESLLSRLRDQTLVLSSEIASALLALVDCIRQMLSSIERTNAEGDTDCTALVERLTDLQEPGNARPERSGQPATTDEDAGGLAVRPDALAEPLESRRGTQSGGNVRVDVEQLDRLMNLVGELVLIRNEILQRMSAREDPGLLSSSQRLDAVTTELQAGIMKTRLQPIDNVWNKFPRMVRDLSLECGKAIRLEMEGKDTELDKTLIEAIRDPLTHVLRNAIDHGLETPDRRVRAGKPAEGRLSLRAFHEGGEVNIEVADDGGGVDLFAIKRKALEHGLITSDQARDMSEQELMELIFLPGFSTATTVTNTSGRGVGMDVVRTNIAKIGGKVIVHSDVGRGTTLKIRIPLTLAIMPALIVAAGGDRYAIPQVNVLELVRLEGDDLRTRIQKFQDAAVFRRRGESLPLVRLDVELGTGSRHAEAGSAGGDEVAHIVVLQADGRKFGLVVDNVNDTQEIVVKPLMNLLKGISIFAGATILGDGGAVLILDIPGFAVHARVLSERREVKSRPAGLLPHEPPDATQSLLTFEGDDEARMAVPLWQIQRLEEFLDSSLERSGTRDVVQYLGEIMPLVNIADLLPERRRERRHATPVREAGALIQTIIYANDGRRVGVVVNRFLDTVEQSLADLRPASRRGAVASAVIQGRVTEILDLDEIFAGLTSAVASTPSLEEARA